MLPEHLAALAARAGCGRRPTVAAAGATADRNPVVRYLADALRFYMEFHSRYDGFYGAFIHDPLALAAALDPTLVRTEPLTVDVELGGRLTTGETVTDWRRVWGRPPNVDVAVEADSARFFARFIERVGALAARSALTAARQTWQAFAARHPNIRPGRACCGGFDELRLAARLHGDRDDAVRATRPGRLPGGPAARES